MDAKFKIALTAYSELLSAISENHNIIRMEFKLLRSAEVCLILFRENAATLMWNCAVTERVKVWALACNQAIEINEFMNPKDFTSCYHVLIVAKEGEKYMESNKTPLYDSVFKFKDLLQYLKDKSFSDEVSITMRLKDPRSTDLLCIDMEIPNVRAPFVMEIIAPWVREWFNRNGITQGEYTVTTQWPKGDVAILTYDIGLSVLATHD